MRYRVFRDLLEDKQPSFEFLKELNGPVHAHVPPGNLGCARLETCFPDEKNLLETAYDDFRDYLAASGIRQGPAYRFICQQRESACFEAYTVSFHPDRCVISAADTEGIRRALVFVEDEMLRRGGSLPTSGIIEKKPWLRSRIARCVFSPLNKHLPDSEELADDIEYYSDNYLNRLAHDGVNGIWISTAFRFMLPSKIIPEYGINWEKSIAKLNKTIAQCARYGIGVYLLANEPASTYMNDALHLHPEVMGSYQGKPNGLVCMSRPQGAAYAEEAGRTLFTLAPDLRGLIVISAGESLSSCASSPKLECDLCAEKGLTLGTAFAACEEALWRGISSVKPDADFISWSYDHRSWDPEDIREACRHRGDNIIHMQNFEDYGINQQLGKPRLALDYWLSYVGPGEVFKESVIINRERGHETFAKLQVACSHETAAIPYVPVPGILFEKFKVMHESGVTGAQYSWYFGSYPSLMTKAAGELAFRDDFSDKQAFLRELAALYWQEDAGKVAAAWDMFSESYQNVPSSVAFEWYGPLNDAPVWKLFLKPVDLPLAKAWKAEDHNGDRFGECILHTFTPDEVCTLLERLYCGWQEGLGKLSFDRMSLEQQAQSRIAQALGLMFESAYHAMLFYTLRNELGLQRGDAMSHWQNMRQIVLREIELSRELADLCSAEGSIGYHSEALAYKIFPEKLLWRARELEKSLESDFAEVKQRIAAGQIPLTFYYGEEEDSHRYIISGSDINEAPWERFTYEDGEPDRTSAVRFACDGGDYVMQIRLPQEATLKLQGEYTFFVPSAPVLLIKETSTDSAGGFKVEVMSPLSYGLFGSAAHDETCRYRCSSQDGILTVRLSKKDFGLKDKEPFRLMLRREGDRPSYWVKPDRVFQRLIFGTYSPDALGFILP